MSVSAECRLADIFPTGGNFSQVPFPDLDRNRQCAKGQAAMPSAVRVNHTAQEAGVPIVTGLGPRNSCKDRHPPDAIVLW